MEMSETMIDTEVKELEELVTTMRRELHQIPELGLEEKQTAAYIRKKLASYGVSETYEVIETGTIAVLRGEKQGKHWLFVQILMHCRSKNRQAMSLLQKQRGKCMLAGMMVIWQRYWGLSLICISTRKKFRGRLFLSFNPLKKDLAAQN